MQHNLSEKEARIVGCLMEKSVVTPDQYPLTTNALTNACNQKSARNPVLSLESRAVQQAARELAEKHYLQVEQNFKNGVEKYRQRFCNSTFSSYQFDPAQFAIVCLLLLRGPQTPGELRAHSGRLHSFADNEAVVTTLLSLLDYDGQALVVKLPRIPGRKDSQYMHLFSGEVDIAAVAETNKEPKRAAMAEHLEHTSVEELGQRVDALEAEVAQLKALLQAQDMKS